MKKLVLIVIAAAVLGWGLLAALAAGAERRLAARPWPNGLGSLNDVPPRYPERNVETPAALALIRLTAPLGVDLKPRDGRTVTASAARADFKAIEKPLHDYVDAQIVRTSGAVDAPPPLLVGYFADRRTELDAVRAHLLSGERIAWKTQLSRGFDAPIPNLLGHMELMRLFLADAFVKARGGDAASWDDLHAVWTLDAGLRSRPDLISQLIAIASARMINAAAVKLPLPAPAWLGEVRAFDYRTSVAASMQAEAWSWTHAQSLRGGWLARPYVQLSAANAAEVMRAAFVRMAASNACHVDDAALTNAFISSIPRWNALARIAIPNIAGAWQRVARVTPELELTEKVLQLRRGETPARDSRCSDGQWLVSASAVKFTPALPAPKTGINYPLEYAATTSF